ncbi:adenylyl-sulfate kinase [Candidatus Woesearchaeota archaeon]|nr:adenylyl-sulfate kinase [Candidatus Woesearchaeota archaeon]
MSNDSFTEHNGFISREDKLNLLGLKENKVLWLTGLSGSGKSTISVATQKALHDLGILTASIDGDNTRRGINNDLSLSPAGRDENIRRFSHMAKMAYNNGLYVLVSAISPYKEKRAFARSLIPPNDFIEIYVNTPLEVCIQRDTKGLYARAAKGEIKDLTGFHDSAPYEPPTNPEIELSPHICSVDECVNQIIQYLNLRKN